MAKLMKASPLTARRCATPSIAIEGKEIGADALLTQRTFAAYLVEQRQAHYHFTVKGYQPHLFEDIALYFRNRQEPDFVMGPSLRL